MLCVCVCVCVPTVDIADTDELREVCSGMYGGKDAYISCEYSSPSCLDSPTHIAFTVSFSQSSRGQLALVFYEWSDIQYLGVETPGANPGDEESIVSRSIISDSDVHLLTPLYTKANVYLHDCCS